jgi:hypothetical protein
MTISTDDILYPSSTFGTPQEYVVCFLLVLIHLTFDVIIVQLYRGKLLEVNSVTWKYSMAIISAAWLRHTVLLIVLYIDCPKVTSLFYAILGGIISTLAVCGMAHILKRGFCNSTVITPARLTFVQTIFLVLHVVLFGPYYFLIVRYPYEKTPFSIKVSIV